ncbi:MAG TPA: DUF1178 family protein [Accumulibacter sp.]|nr:DUF1178 family protein [Accumulibacter sp.]
MIIFDLTCAHEHRFEGWFQSAEDFASQRERDLIACPICASTEIRRVPSAIHLSRTAGNMTAPGKHPALSSSEEAAAALAAYQRMTTVLLANCEDVGHRFAEEARKIHYLEAPERSIRGETTSEEFAALQEEGIVVFRLPVIKTGDLH